MKIQRCILINGQASNLLYATNRNALLFVFQGMDAAGKDGTIKHVMSGVNPQGCQVFSFKHPSAIELQHGFLLELMILKKTGNSAMQTLKSALIGINIRLFIVNVSLQVAQKMLHGT